MPLLYGKKARSKKGFSENIEREKHAHPDMPNKQAVAIAYSAARRPSGHKKHSSRHHGKGRG